MDKAIVPENKPLSTLQSRVNDRLALWQLIGEANGEITPAIESWLAETEKNLALKVDGYNFILEELEAESVRLKAEAKTFSEASKSLETIRDNMKLRIKGAMLQLGATEMLGNNYRFKLSPMADKVVIDDLTLPDEYRKLVTPDPYLAIDKEKIQADLNLKVEVPGVTVEPVNALRVYVNKKGGK